MKMLALAAEFVIKWKKNSVFQWRICKSQRHLWYHLGTELCIRTGCWEDARESLNIYFQTENTAVNELAEKVSDLQKMWMLRKSFHTETKQTNQCWLCTKVSYMRNAQLPNSSICQRIILLSLSFRVLCDVCYTAYDTCCAAIHY